MHLSHTRGVFLLLFSLLAAISLTAGNACAANVKWIDPPPFSIVSTPKIVVGGFSSEPVSKDAVATVKTPQTPEPFLQVKPQIKEDQFFYLTLELKPGRNNVLFDDSVYSVYYLADDSAKTVDPELASFKPYTPHLKESASCARCHGVFQKELTLNAEVFDLCTKCHGALKKEMKPSSRAGHHEKNLTPYCVACHDPHPSRTAGLLKEKGDLCTGCHKERASGKGHDGASPQPCTLCHDPHLEINGAMLKKPKAEVCTGCHELNALVSGAGIASSHRIVRTSPCGTCHSSHYEGNPSLLKDNPEVLCRACHKETTTVGHKEPAGDCLSCHKGHSSTMPALTKSNISGYCAKCHPKNYDGPSAHKLAKDKECFACHSPHQLSQGKKIFQYCGSCHSASDKAFNYAHGDMPFETARQCLICHQLHRPEEAPKTRALLGGTAHYPLKNGGCPVCHAVKNGKISMRYEGNENCIRCHGSAVGISSSLDKEKVHAPIRQDDCIACHNPHYKERPAMLLEEKERVCEFCHGNITRMGPNKHEPLEEKDACLICHVPHYSESRPLLKKDQKDLCLGCHDEMAKVLADANLHGALKEQDCTACHTPHTTAESKNLKKPAGELCVGCHPQAVRDRNNMPYNRLHGPVGANQCTACHYFTHTHREEGDKFLNQKPAWLVCQECHEITNEHVPAIYVNRLARNQDGCLGCHFPHGSSGSYMLKE